MQNEDKAKASYRQLVASEHDNFTLSVTGLHINVAFPHLGASLDSLISCSCSDDGVLEIKCPYSLSGGLPTDARFLKDNKLSQQHQYYYQVQGQMGVLERSYSDFVVWTPRDILIQRITFDQTFFELMKKQLDLFFLKVIMPKILIGAEKEDKHPSEEEGIYCYCRQGEFGDMVLCDGPVCKFGWFHFGCVNLTTAPVGTRFVLIVFLISNRIVFHYEQCTYCCFSNRE